VFKYNSKFLKVTHIQHNEWHDLTETNPCSVHCGPVT